MTAVTFDYGQTLGELDTTFLARRVAERGATANAEDLDRAMPRAWAEYDAAKKRGEAGHDAWTSFMRALLSHGNVTTEDPGQTERTVAAIAEFLWTEQPRRNLWRRPIAGMRELVQDLARRRVPLGIVSNSEGRLAELLETMELLPYFGVVADSGVLGVEKPDARIFEWTLSQLAASRLDWIHVGDAWVADIEGALALGARTIWITNEPGTRNLPERVVACRTADDVRATLAAWGVL